MSRQLLSMAASLVLLAVTGCTSSSGGAATSGPASRSSTAESPATVSTSAVSTPSHPSSHPRPHPDLAQRTLAAMGEAERVGQLLMVDCPTTSVGPNTVSAIQNYHVGSVILDGTSTQGMSVTQGVTGSLQQLAPSGDKLLISTDQEGGLVQRLRGTGFSSIPTAVVQGTYAPATLKADATTWGQQLRQAGVNVDLAPVLDTVPADFGSNPPIGDLQREYGHDPATVSSHGNAYAQGMAAAGVDATVKHFPGLGRVTGNTDTTLGVTDNVTTRHDPYLQPFATAIKQGVAFVMVSSAIYAKIDPNSPAAFSSTVINGMLRHDLHFTGVVISDDLGNAKAVSDFSVGDRAVKFVAAGGDMVLTVDASQAQTMTSALLAKAGASPAFKKIVDAAALRVLEAKKARGLLS